MLSGPGRHVAIQPYESLVHDPLAKISPHFCWFRPMKVHRCIGFQKVDGSVGDAMRDWESAKGALLLTD